MELKFLNPHKVLHSTGLNNGEVVVDFGAGSGFFVIEAAKMVGKSGHVYAVDVLEKPLEHISSEARIKHLTNVKTIRHDLEKGEIKPIPSGVAHVLVISNVLHQLKNPVNALSEAYRILKTSGKLLVIDWTKDHVIGPKVKQITSDEVKSVVQKFGFKFESETETDKFHYGLIFIK